MASKKYKVVIIGSGFAGVKSAIELCDDGRFDVTLISNRSDLQIYGSLYHTVTGGSSRVASIPLREIFSERKITIIHDEATEIDRKKYLVKTKSSGDFNFTALLIGIGVRTNFFGIDGLEEYSYGIKTLAEAEELKVKLHEDLKTSYLHGMHYVVVGGGPTGIELAGMLPEYIKTIAEYHGLPHRKVHVDLIEASPRLLPRMPKNISKSVAKNLRNQGVNLYLNTAVQGQTADELMIHGKPIRSHTVIWTAGMANNEFFKVNKFQLSNNGKVRVDLYLQAEPGIYVLGDNADTPFSGMAQTALHDARFVTNNLIRVVNGLEPEPYKAKKPVYVLPAGPKWAAVVWGNISFSGRFGWWLRRVADFVAYKDYTSWPMTFSRFIADRDKEETCPHCADDLA